jgi:hypothetical protein
VTQTSRKPPKKRPGVATGRRRVDGELLDVAGAAQFFGTTEKAIRARVARQLLPHRRWGARVVFLRADLVGFIGRLEGVSVDEAIANADRGDESRQR